MDDIIYVVFDSDGRAIAITKTAQGAQKVSNECSRVTNRFDFYVEEMEFDRDILNLVEDWGEL